MLRLLCSSIAQGKVDMQAEERHHASRHGQVPCCALFNKIIAQLSGYAIPPNVDHLHEGQRSSSNLCTSGTNATFQLPDASVTAGCAHELSAEEAQWGLAFWCHHASCSPWNGVCLFPYLEWGPEQYPHLVSCCPWNEQDHIMQNCSMTVATQFLPAHQHIRGCQ